MEKTSTIKRSAGKQDDVFDEMMVNELNFCVNQVKEEIRSVFAKHRKSLASRELWLLDQLHSIKDGCFAAVFTQQISFAEMTARLEQCATFSQLSKDCDFVKGMELVSEVAKPLYKRAKECQEQMKESLMPSVRFIHDKVHFRNAILSYGKLETDFQGADADDAGSFASEHSWDFVDEKAEVECSDKNGCGVGTTACSQQREIEDMDVSKLLVEYDLPMVSNSFNVLKSVCKANELCESISDCVCDVPCLAVPSSGKSNSAVDPVSDLQQKLKAIFQTSKSDPQLNEVEDIGQEAMETRTTLPQEELSDKDLLLQISTTVHSLLSNPLEDGKSSFSCSQSVQESCVLISDLQQKLQGILDGEEDSENIFCEKKPDVYGRVEYESLSQDSSVSRSFEEENDIVVSLHGRLGKIYQEGVKYVVERSEMTPQLPTSSDQENDPVVMLSKQLQQVLAC